MNSEPKCLFGAILAALLLWAVSGDAQEVVPPRPAAPNPAPTLPRAVPSEEPDVPVPSPTPNASTETYAPAASPATAVPDLGTFSPPPTIVDPGTGAAAPASPAAIAVADFEAESLPDELSEDIWGAPNRVRMGPTAVSDVRFLMDNLGFKHWIGDSGIRTFGWIEGGHTGSSTGTGLLSVETRQNRFGNEFLLNQIGLVIQKPLRQDQFDLGFNIRYFAGADAALGQPKGGIGYPVGNPHFGQDFRDLYVSAHLPIITEGGMDVKFGRMNTIIGYNGFLSPYRPFYSSDYQFFYSQDGAFTGLLGDLHVNERFDFWSGVTLGANTFFTKRSSNSICYIGQMNYWLTDEHKTRLTGSVYAGPNAIFAAPGLAGTFDTTVELRIQQNWNERITQIIQSNMGWDANTPVGTGSWYGVYTIGIFHLTRQVDTLVRAEWFDDVKGTRTGFNTNFSEVTLGLNWHPFKCLEFRPEIRGDFAGGAPAFGVGVPTHHSQLTGGISTLIKF